MGDQRCPGQNQQNWKPGDIFEAPCPWCGQAIEFWKDEPVRVCSGCQKEVRNPRIDLGCAKWCKASGQCLGDLAHSSECADSMLELLIDAMQKTFGDDSRRIRHALQVLDFARAIQRAEGGDKLVVQAAAVLHDIGIQEAERKHGSSAGRYQEIEGPPIARRIMQNLELPAPAIEHVCRIAGSHHSAHDIDTLEFRILWDADWLVNFPDEYPQTDREELTRLIDCTFRTNRGRELARELFLNDE